MKKTLYLIIFLLIIFQVGNVFATENVWITSGISNIKKGQEFFISINAKNVSVAAFQLELYFDSDKIEFISGPANCNKVGNTILCAWFDETGGNNPKTDSELITLKFRAKESKEAVYGVHGELFDTNGNKIAIESLGTSIYISGENDRENTNGQNNINVTADNSNLKIMRLDIEGITPSFDKNITEYYLTVDLGISSINITAIPENHEAIVNVNGNNMLKEGISKITIEVISKDKSKNKIYTINVTRTNEKKFADTDLETLAIEYFRLEPEFSSNATHYKTSVTSDTEKVNIFAVPKDYLAKVDITNMGNLKYGDNIIKVTVTAQNKITKKDYIINVYRRTPEEDEEEAKRQEVNARRLANIIANKEAKRLSNIPEKTNGNRYAIPLLIVTLTIILAIVVAYVTVINKKIKNFKKKK